MKNLNLQKIEIKKTKISVILESECKNVENENETFKNLLAVSLLSGASGNNFRQLLNTRLSQTFDFEKLSELQNKMDVLIHEMRKEIDRTEDFDGINYSTTIFK